MDDFVKMVESTLKGDRDRFLNFLSLVRKMREAQKKCDRFVSRVINMSHAEYDALTSVERLEAEVDEYLKEQEEQL